MVAQLRACLKCKFFLPEENFWRAGKGLQNWCIPCKKEYMNAYMASIPDYGKVIYQRHKEAMRSSTLFRKYGIRQEGYEKLLLEQDGKCAICGKTAESCLHGVLHVDHCHKSGKIRGLLCRGCNHILGTVGDDPAVLSRAIHYLSMAQTDNEEQS